MDVTWGSLVTRSPVDDVAFVTLNRYEDRSGAGFVKLNPDRSGAGFVTLNRYQDRCRGQGRCSGRARGVAGAGDVAVARTCDVAWNAATCEIREAPDVNNI